VAGFAIISRVALCHLAGETLTRNRHRLTPLSDDIDPPDPAPSFAEESDQRFLELWRSQLLERTWAALEQSSIANNDQSFEMLQLKSANLETNSVMMAQELARRHGRPYSSDGVRQALHRARTKFAELLRAEVAASIPSTDPVEVDAELAELGLLIYCPPVPESTRG